MPDVPLRSWVAESVRQMFHRLAGQAPTVAHTVWKLDRPGSAEVGGFMIFRSMKPKTPIILWFDGEGESYSLMLTWQVGDVETTEQITIRGLKELPLLEQRVRKALKI